ncbi:MAG: sulfatase-like hydrolase/transferase [Leptospiraceae bacterium]|nr:sulfatase-like hydrolase/transferase [Leptospiraceae bacterium]
MILKNEIPEILIQVKFLFGFSLLSFLLSIVIIFRFKKLIIIYFLTIILTVLISIFVFVVTKGQDIDYSLDYTHLNYLNDGKIELPKIKENQINDLVKNFSFEKNTNIVFFIFESVNSESFIQAQNSQKLIDEANVIINNFFIPIPHTSSSIYSLLYGDYGSYGFRKDINLQKNKLSLPRVLKSKGYKNYFLTTSPLHFDNIYNYLSHLPIEVKDIESFKKKYPKEEFFEWGLDDKILLDETKLLFEENRESILLYYFFSNTHSPYYSKGNDEQPINRFKKALEYDLSIMIEIINYIKLKNKNSVFVILGDHGESFGEHGFHKHGFSLYNTEIKIPFYLILPNYNKKVTIDTGTILDINHSLLSLTDLQTDSLNSNQNFFSKKYQLQLNLRTWGDVNSRGLIVNDTKWIFDFKNQILLKMDLAETSISNISKSKLAVKFGNMLKFLLD